jgi:hypothetical protein
VVAEARRLVFSVLSHDADVIGLVVQSGQGEEVKKLKRMIDILSRENQVFMYSL